jgi:hypothetical protein
MEHLNAQHCLTIAAAFIAIVAACASLITVANGKSDSIANRYRELTREYREGATKEGRAGFDNTRLDQLQKQIGLYKERVSMVVEAQCLLFRTIGIFVFSIAVFIGLALFIVFNNLTDEQIKYSAQIPLGVIAASVLFGASYMFRAIYRLYLEVRKAAETFDIETSDCLPSNVRRLKDGLQVA